MCVRPHMHVCVCVCDCGLLVVGVGLGVYCGIHTQKKRGVFLSVCVPGASVLITSCQYVGATCSGGVLMNLGRGGTVSVYVCGRERELSECGEPTWPRPEELCGGPGRRPAWLTAPRNCPYHSFLLPLGTLWERDQRTLRSFGSQESGRGMIMTVAGHRSLQMEKRQPRRWSHGGPVGLWARGEVLISLCVPWCHQLCSPWHTQTQLGHRAGRLPRQQCWDLQAVPASPESRSLPSILFFGA